MASTNEAPPEGISSILDTDLYKLTMQCAVLKYFPDTHVTYAFTNRTPHMQLTRAAFEWLEKQVAKLANLSLQPDELSYLQSACPFLAPPYLAYLQAYRFKPSQHVSLVFESSNTTSADASPTDTGTIALTVAGPWIETILYEIPLLALTSEAYFAHVDKDWTYSGQEAAAYAKAASLLKAGIAFSEFGTRRRRDYKTQALVVAGLARAARDHPGEGRLVGSSNVHFAMRHGLTPVGTVAHEWFMGIAASSGDVGSASEKALECWVECFGEGVLGIALTDTFGTPAFLRAFSRPVPGAEDGHSYAVSFAGVRQDSGDPEAFIETMRRYYDGEGIGEKTVIFSDSLNVERCLRYDKFARKKGFYPSFGIGTHLTNDFTRKNSDEKSKPLNIVIKLSSANGQPAVKLSDEMGKNTGDAATVQRTKEALGYTDKHWEGANEASRW